MQYFYTYPKLFFIFIIVLPKRLHVLHTVSKLYDVTVNFVTPPLIWGSVLLIFGRQRVALPRHRMICPISVAFVSPTDRPESVQNRCEIEIFGGVFVLSHCFFLTFCRCRRFCHRTEIYLFLFLLHMFFLLRAFFSRNCRYFPELCYSNIPRYFLDFACLVLTHTFAVKIIY